MRLQVRVLSAVYRESLTFVVVAQSTHSPHHAVNYGWNMLMYTVYTLVFVLFGSFIGLSVRTTRIANVLPSASPDIASSK